MKKRNYALMLFALAAGTVLFAATTPDPELLLNNKPVFTTPNYLLLEDTVYLPLPESAQALGIVASHDAANQAVFLRYQKVLVVIDAKRSQAIMGDQVIALAHAPIWVSGQVYVPQEVFTEVLAKAMAAQIKIVYQAPAPTPPPSPPPTSPGPGNPSPPAPPGSALRNRVDVIVIDAGHGGHDPGAIGPNGLKEKDVVLVLARKLRDRLRREPDLAVCLTRDGDTFVPLRDRPAKARALGADVFLSIHANAARRIAAAGFETYFASLTASDAAALDLAIFENQIVPGGAPSPAPVTDDISAILGDMAQAEYLADSERLAVMIQEEMARVMKSENRGVKQAPFRVLMDATMPAALVEVGFITSPAEARLITSPEVQDKIVEALATALLRYRDQTNARLGLPPKPPAPGVGP